LLQRKKGAPRVSHATTPVLAILFDESQEKFYVAQHSGRVAINIGEFTSIVEAASLKRMENHFA
jgi:hypothetical protein